MSCLENDSLYEEKLEAFSTEILEDYELQGLIGEHFAEPLELWERTKMDNLEAYNDCIERVFDEIWELDMEMACGDPESALLFLIKGRRRLQVNPNTQDEDYNFLDDLQDVRVSRERELDEISSDFRQAESQLKKLAFRSFTFRVTDEWQLGWDADERRLKAYGRAGAINRPVIETKFYIREELHPYLALFVKEIIKNNGY